MIVGKSATNDTSYLFLSKYNFLVLISFTSNKLTFWKDNNWNHPDHPICLTQITKLHVYLLKNAPFANLSNWVQQHWQLKLSKKASSTTIIQSQVIIHDRGSSINWNMKEWKRIGYRYPCHYLQPQKKCYLMEIFKAIVYIDNCNSDKTRLHDYLFFAYKQFTNTIFDTWLEDVSFC